MDNTGMCCPAHKIKLVVRSTLAAEILILQEGLEMGYYYVQEDVGGHFGPRTQSYQD